MKWFVVLTSVALGVLIVTAGDAVSDTGPYRSAASGAYAAPADTIEKEKVKKKIREKEEGPMDGMIKLKEKRGGPDRKEDKNSYERVSEEKPGFWEQCAVDCLSDILGSICSGMISSAFGDDEEAAPEVGLEEPAAIGTVETEVPMESGTGADETDAPDALPYPAVVTPITPEEAGVLLWDWPGGEAMNAGVIDTLSMGAEVSVMKMTQTGTIYWVKVKTVEDPDITGWIREREASPIEPPDLR